MTLFFVEEPNPVAIPIIIAPKIAKIVHSKVVGRPVIT